MSDITVFAFDTQAVRVMTVDGDPWFVGKDVASVLGYTNHNKALGDHCKGVTKRYPLQTPGGTQEVRIISEPDMLRLIVGSKLPAAERFERWVFEEVLPSIRKTGRYESPPPDLGTPPRLPQPADWINLANRHREHAHWSEWRDEWLHRFHTLRARVNDQANGLLKKDGA